MTRYPRESDALSLKKNRLLTLALALLIILSSPTLSACGSKGIMKGWSGATLKDGILFLGTMDTKLVAINPESGTRLWSVTLQSEKPRTGISSYFLPSVFEAIYSTPAAQGELVYVGSYIRIGSDERGKLYAFTVSKGEQVWVYPRDGTLEGAIVGGLTTAQNKVYFGTTAGKVYALDALTGEKKWEFKAGGEVWAAPVLSDNTIFIGSFDKKLYALDALTGGYKWHFEADGPVVGTPLVHGDTIYFGSYNWQSYALNAQTGEKKWEFKAKKGFWASPIIDGNTIYLPSLDGKVYILDINSGREVAQAFNVNKMVCSTPVVVDNWVIVAASNGRIYTINTGNNQGDLLKDLKEPVQASLFSEGRVIYVHSQSPDSLHALTPQGGTLWSLALISK